jgi:hypothetical protein
MLMNLTEAARATGILLRDWSAAWSSPVALESSTRPSPDRFFTRIPHTGSGSLSHANTGSCCTNRVSN